MAIIPRRVAQHIPVAGQVYGVIEVAKQVSHATDPIQAAMVAGEIILEDCLPPNECTILLAECGAVIHSFAAAPATGGFSLSISFASVKRVIIRRL